MSLASKIILGLIIAASLPLAYLSMRALKTHDSWRTAFQKAEQDLARSEISARLLADSEDETALSNQLMYSPGAESAPGNRQLDQQLKGILVDRGRAWYAAAVLNVDPNTDLATVQLGPIPDPHHVVAGMTVFPFEERDVRGAADNPQRGEYLGAFAVTSVDGQTIQLRPTMKLSPREHDRLLASQQSGVTWAIYEVMPVDRHGTFAGLSDEELQTLMPDTIVPQSIRDQYLKDGQPAEPGNPAEHVVDGVYRRPLRDYMVLFSEHHRLRALAADSIASDTKDNELLAADLADIDRQQEFRRQEIASLTAELAHTNAELALAKRIHDEYEVRLAEVRRQVERALAENKQMVDQWQTLQLLAARKIDEATASQHATAVE